MDFKGYGKWIVLASLILTCFIFFQLFYPYHLFFREQTSLFLFTRDFFLQTFNKPGWLATYTGNFLTQFNYLRGGGPLVLTLVVALEFYSVLKLLGKFNYGKSTILLALFPALTDMVLHTVFLHSLAVSVAFLLSLLLFGVYQTVATKKFASVFIALSIGFIAYWAIGSASFLLPFLIVAYDLHEKRFQYLNWILVCIPIVASPFLLRSYYLVTQGQAFLYPVLVENSMLLYCIALIVFFVSLVIAKLEKRFYKATFSVLSILLIVWLGLGIRSNANFNFEKILALDSEYYFQNYEKVTKLAQRFSLKNRYATYYINMSLAQQGLLPDRLLEFYQPFSDGLILPVSTNEKWQTILFSNEAFYLIGDMGFAQHSAMLGITFSPNQTGSRMIKRLAEINMVNHDYPAALKYLSLLEHTMFHKQWAKNRMDEIMQDKMNFFIQKKQKQAIPADTLYKTYDYLAGLQFMVNHNAQNTIALDYLLCYHLLNKDLHSFQMLYDKHLKNKEMPVSKVYSEALLINLFAARASEDEVINYRITNPTTAQFLSYTKEVEHAEGNFSQLTSSYGNTYWYYYHFATKPKVNHAE